MSREPITDIVIPARDCEGSLGAVLAAVPSGLVRSIVVVDSGSRDHTAAVARDGGAVVVRQPRGGRGAACKRGVNHLENLPEPPDVAVFMAADGSDDPGDLPLLLEPIWADNAELVVGTRQRRAVGDQLSLKLIGALYRHRFVDLGPYRAVRFAALVALGLRDPGEGWDAEMQVKALRLGLNIVEVPVTQGAGERQGLSARASKAGRSLVQILRHSTVR